MDIIPSYIKDKETGKSIKVDVRATRADFHLGCAFDYGMAVVSSLRSYGPSDAVALGALARRAARHAIAYAALVDR